MADPVLTAVTRPQGNNRALVTGEVTPRGFALELVDVPVLVQAFRRMVRSQEFDVSEMALTTYLVARAHGVPITAVPAFLVRGFHHGAVQVLAGSGVEPADLAGRRVGVNRGYTVTTGVWARDVLATEHGVDLDAVTWVLSGDEHVEAYRPPGNVTSLRAGQTFADGLRSGDLAAVIGADLDEPDVVPLLPDAVEAGFRAFRDRGLYPINHLVVVTDDVLARHPDAGVAVLEAFSESKRRYVAGLRAGAVTDPSPADRLHLRMLEQTGQDPLPYGVEPNRAVLEHLLHAAVDQHILDRPPVLEELFAPGTRDLVG